MSPENKKALIIDFDGTLCDAKGRRHYLDGDKPNYNKFYESAIFSLPNEWCVEIIKRFSVDHTILIVTGQPAEYHRNIKDWLGKYLIPYHKILGRKSGDFRKDNTIKLEIYETEIKDKYRIIFCVDDRKRVSDMWREQGLVVLQCEEGNF